MMKTIFILGCLALSSAFAETLNDVEYQIPQNEKKWVVGNKMENDQGTTLIYIPSANVKQNTNEFFGISATKLKTDINDTNSIKEVLTRLYPKFKVEVTILDKSNDGFLYEWTAKNDDKEVLHGWGRALANKDGTVIMGFQTSDIEGLETAKSTWLPILKAARIKTP